MSSFPSKLSRLSVILLIAIISLNDSSISPKCLKHSPSEALQHRFFHYGGKRLPLTIDSSERVTHKIVSYMFAIFLKEVLGYQDVELIHHSDYFFNETISIQRLAIMENDFGEPLHPKALFNLEVWLSSDISIPRSYKIHETGPISSPGRFGWFFGGGGSGSSSELFFSEVSWLSFKNTSFAGKFSLSGKFLVKVINAAKANFEQSPSILYHNGIFTPSRCHYASQNGSACALLLASDFEATKAVVNHIETMGMFVKVAWLGSEFFKIAQEIRLHSQQDVLVMHWTPGELNVMGNGFLWKPVTFPPCYLAIHFSSFQCFYDTRRRMKLVSDIVSKEAPAAFEAANDIEFSLNDYEELLLLMASTSASITANVSAEQQVACDWLNKHESRWRMWIPMTEEKSTIDIVGIFPMSGSMAQSISGVAIAAQMAVNAVNMNRLVLPYHRLEMIVHDGRCNVDTVMNKFIDYIRENEQKNLAGVVGPACSDTVEPLVGVTKYFRTAVISYSAEGFILSDKNQLPYFFRTIGGNQEFRFVYLALLETLGWKRIAALSEEGQKTAEYLTLMQDLLQERNMTLVTHRKIPRQLKPALNGSLKNSLKDLHKRQARIVILDVRDHAARSILCEAFHLNMTARFGYVWFLPHWLSKSWYHINDDGGLKASDVNCSTAQMKEAIEGHFRLIHESFAPENATEINENLTITEWKLNYMKELSHINFRYPWSDYAGYAYDAIWVYAYALHNLYQIDEPCLDDMHSENCSAKFDNLIQKTNFYGVSGRVSFNDAGSRQINVLVQQWSQSLIDYKTIGCYDPVSERLDLNQSLIRWYTRNQRIPEDGTQPPYCYAQTLAELFNISCTAALILHNSCYVIPFLLLGIFYVFYNRFRYKKKMKQYELTRQYMKSMGFDLVSTNMVQMDKWEIPRNNVVINRILGQGAFGTVFGGEALFQDTGWIAVAVKTLKANATTEQKLAYLSEAEVMKSFNHANLVRLLGMCTKEEPVYTVIEFMLYGDLKTFLLNRRHLVSAHINCYNTSAGNNNNEMSDISPKKLTSFAVDIARGLSYLNSIKYVHRDLACRNILISSRRVAKIGDFGLTRPLHESADYCKFSRRGMMPVRWMAPESLADGIFNHATDIWSFGIVLWEIVTFGSYPWKGLSNAQVVEEVKSGRILDSPKGIKFQLDTLLKMCWKFEGKRRPTAQWIVDYFSFNSRCLTPCLDLPTQSVAFEDSDRFSTSASAYAPRRRHHHQEQHHHHYTNTCQTEPFLLINPMMTVSRDFVNDDYTEAKAGLVVKSPRRSSYDREVEELSCFNDIIEMRRFIEEREPLWVKESTDSIASDQCAGSEGYQSASLHADDFDDVVK